MRSLAMLMAVVGMQALAQGAAPEVVKVPLPGGPGRVVMDYLAFDVASGRVWAPTGKGQVNAIDAATLKLTSIDGFATAVKGERTLGPSSVSVAPGRVYVGNRADSKVCAIDSKAMKLEGCVELLSPPDGVAFVASVNEVWVTTPKDKSLTVLDVATANAPKSKVVIKLDGEPEGYAVDAAHGRFFTNLEDKDVTLEFDVKTHKELSRLKPGCGEAGPRGLALDAERQLLIVACTDKVVVFKLGKSPTRTGEMTTGAGVDNIDYAPGLHRVYAAAGKSGNLTIGELDAKGGLVAVSTVATADGARVVVSDAAGDAFVADSAGGQILVVRASSAGVKP